MTRRTLFAWLLCLPAALLTLDAMLGLQALKGGARIVAAVVAVGLLFVAIHVGKRETGGAAAQPWDAKRWTATILLFPIVLFGGNYVFDLGFFPGRDKQLGVLVSMVSAGIILLMKRKA